MRYVPATSDIGHVRGHVSTATYAGPRARGTRRYVELEVYLVGRMKHVQIRRAKFTANAE